MSMTLEGRKIHLLHAGERGFLVTSGEVLVALQPYRDKKPLRRLYLGTAKIGDYIPAPAAPVIDDETGETVSVAYLLSANAPAVIKEVKDKSEWTEFYRAYLSDSYVRRAQDADADDPYVTAAPDGADRDGSNDREALFWAAVTRLYTGRERQFSESVKRREEEDRAFDERTGRRLASAFQSHFRYRMLSAGKRVGGLYDAAAFLCTFKGMTCVPYEYLVKSAGEGYTVFDIARLSGFAARKVRIREQWQKRADDAVLVFAQGEDGRKGMVVYPRFGRLYLHDPATGDTRRFRREDAAQLSETAYVFDRPFAKSTVNMKEILRFCVKDISLRDLIVMGAAILLLGQVGVALSVLHQRIYGDIIPGGDEAFAVGLGIVFLSVLLANFLITVAKNLTDYRIGIRMKNRVQLAIFHHVFHLPERYFREREGAAEAYRMTVLSDTSTSLLRAAGNVVTECVLAVCYLLRMFHCSPGLSVIGLLVAAVQIVITFLFSYLLRKTERVNIAQTAKIRSRLYQMIAGIGTIRTAGSTAAARGQYMEEEVTLARNRRRSDRLRMINTLLLSLSNALCMLLVYYVIGTQQTDVTLGVFMGFMSANAMFSATVMQMTNAISIMIAMKPMLNEAGGALALPPERDTWTLPLAGLAGDIMLSHVSFGYPGAKRNVLNNISVHIRKGEYVGIAGSSGCGKTTLLRLLLGFEQPTDGQIYYDGVPMSRLPLTELRRRMGAVLQDGSLISGSILENIMISNPDATKEEIDAAIAAAGLKDEIDAMPMGELTHVSEEALTVSGGQKQRILIARAVVGLPKILLFDEATSSLDNISQEKISAALSGLHATRIVVAHRLSTLKLCDRILVMDAGRIVEEGAYEELMERKGRFYEMVKIQQAV